MSRNCKICRYQLADDWPSCPMCGASEPHRVTLGDIALEMEKHERDGWCNKKQPQPAEQESDAEYQDRLSRELVDMQKPASQSASEPDVWLTEDELEDALETANVSERLTLAECISDLLKEKFSYFPSDHCGKEPEQWLTEELIENASRGMSSTELLSFCAEFERRIRADEREKCKQDIAKAMGFNVRSKFNSVEFGEFGQYITFIIGNYIKQLTVARAFIVRLRDTVIGWREKDHPDGFDRRTAEIIAGWVREECKMKTGQSAMKGQDDE